VRCQEQSWKSAPGPISGKRLASTDLKRRLRALQGRGVRNLSYDSDDFLADHPGVAELKAGISLAEFPWEQSR
jgi:hypothetical protein